MGLFKKSSYNQSYYGHNKPKSRKRYPKPRNGYRDTYDSERVCYRGGYNNYRDYKHGSCNSYRGYNNVSSNSYREDCYEDYDQTEDTMTGRILKKLTNGTQKKKKESVICNNLTFEPCQKEGRYQNIKTKECIDV